MNLHTTIPKLAIRYEFKPVQFNTHPQNQLPLEPLLDFQEHSLSKFWMHFMSPSSQIFVGHIVSFFSYRAYDYSTKKHVWVTKFRLHQLSENDIITNFTAVTFHPKLLNCTKNDKRKISSTEAEKEVYTKFWIECFKRREHLQHIEMAIWIVPARNRAQRCGLVWTGSIKDPIAGFFNTTAKWQWTQITLWICSKCLPSSEIAIDINGFFYTRAG
jgi:hypothetical protein